MTRILLDVDGVVSDMLRKLCDDYNTVTVTNVDTVLAEHFTLLPGEKVKNMKKETIRRWEATPEQFLVYDFLSKNMHPKTGGRLVVRDEIKLTGFPNEVERHLAKCIMASDGWCSTLPAYDGALNAVRGFRSKGWEVVFVTTPFYLSSTWASDREDWLLGHMETREDRGDIVHAKNKSYVEGDLFVDDKPENVIEWAEAHPNGVAYLQKRQYNELYFLYRTEPLPANFKFLNHLCELNGEEAEDPWKKNNDRAPIQKGREFHAKKSENK